MAGIEQGCCSKSEPLSGPLDAMKSPPEKLIYVLCLQSPENAATNKCGYLATIDVDPKSSAYGQVIHRLYTDDPEDELHHFGWNSCVSCKNPAIKRKYLIIPGLRSGNIYIVDTGTCPEKPAFLKKLSGVLIKERFNMTYPHTVHCIPTGEVMISYMGDASGNGKGDFLLLDGITFEPKERWNKESLPFGYDFWYQPRHNIMVSTEYGAPKCFINGFDIADVGKGQYGSKVHLWDWSARQLIKSVELGPEGAIPLEVRFLHNPDAIDCFVGAALGSSVFNLHQEEDGRWIMQKVIQVPSKTVENWAFPEMPSLITDILISLDDKFLYFANFVHGDVRQYDISNPRDPKFISSVFLGGSICNDGSVKVTADTELKKQPERPIIKGFPIQGSPNMLQLSRDGMRLYVTFSLLTRWDQQFYPDSIKNGSGIAILNCSKDGVEINQNFYVNLGNEPDGAVRGHEVRYPGGDCSSDIWI